MQSIARQLFEDSPVLHVGDVTLNATDDLCSPRKNWQSAREFLLSQLRPTCHR